MCTFAFWKYYETFTDTMTTDLESLLDRHFPDVPLLLAGSYAMGTATADSDVDLLLFGHEVQSPRISRRQLEGFTIELIELPRKNLLYFLERTAHDSGAYLFMLATGKIIRDDAGFLAALKQWGGQRFMAGPPRDRKHYKINRSLTDVGNLLEDLEGPKQAGEKLLIANQLINDFKNLLVLSNDLWPVTGKWAYRKLEPLYPGLIDSLFLLYKEAIATADYSAMMALVREHLGALELPEEEASSTLLGDTPPGSGPTQIILPRIYLYEMEAAQVEAIMGLRREFPSLYLRDFEEGGTGIVLPDESGKNTEAFTHLLEISPDKNVRYGYEPLLKDIYGGPAYFGIAQDYFRLVTSFTGMLQQRSAPAADGARYLETCAYLLPVFCAQMGIAVAALPSFGRFLHDSWAQQAVDPHNVLRAPRREELLQDLQEQIAQRRASADADFMGIIAAVLADAELRFDDPLFDHWADGLAALSTQLHAQVQEEPPAPSRFQLLAMFREAAPPMLLWPVLLEYLNYLFDLLGVEHKDRLYLVALLYGGSGR